MINNMNFAHEEMQSDQSYTTSNHQRYYGAQSDDPDMYEEEDDYHTEGHKKEFSEPCEGEGCRDWIVKIKDFRPSYQGGGGGGGGATLIFKVSQDECELREICNLHV